MESATWTIAVATIAYVVLTATIAFFAYRAFSEGQRQTRELSGTRWSGYFLEFTRRYDDVWGRMPACMTDEPYTETDWFNDRTGYVTRHIAEMLGPNPEYDIAAQSIEASLQHFRYQKQEELRKHGADLGFGYFPITHGELLRLLDRYFNLCSEEYHLACKGELEKEAWRIWKAGIKQNMGYVTLQSAWQRRRGQYGYYGDFKSWMDNLIEIDSARLNELQP